MNLEQSCQPKRMTPVYFVAVLAVSAVGCSNSRHATFGDAAVEEDEDASQRDQDRDKPKPSDNDTDDRISQGKEDAGTKQSGSGDDEPKNDPKPADDDDEPKDDPKPAAPKPSDAGTDSGASGGNGTPPPSAADAGTPLPAKPDAGTIPPIPTPNPALTECANEFLDCTLDHPTDFPTQCIPAAERCGLFPAGLAQPVACASDYAACIGGDPNAWERCTTELEKCGLLPPGATECAVELQRCVQTNPSGATACLAEAEKCNSLGAELTKCSTELQSCVAKDPADLNTLQACLKEAQECGLLPPAIPVIP